MSRETIAPEKSNESSRAERSYTLAFFSFLSCAAGVLMPVLMTTRWKCRSEVGFLCLDWLVYFSSAMMGGGILIMLSIVLGSLSRSRVVLLWLVPAVTTVVVVLVRAFLRALA